MSLLSSLRRALTPKAAPRGEPPGSMQLGGLQLECPMCSYDVFSRRRFGTLDPNRLATEQRVISLPAIACDRCGAVQLFDPTARSNPKAPIPPRRVAHLKRRPEATVADVADVADDDADVEGVAEAGWAEEETWTADESAADAPTERERGHEGVRQPLLDWELDRGTGADPEPPPAPEAPAEPDSEPQPWLEPGAGPDHAGPGDESLGGQQGAVAPDAPDPAPSPPSDPGAAQPVWPTPLPPLPPLPPLDETGPWGDDPPAR